MKPNYDMWAEALLQEIYYAPEDQRASVVKAALLQASKRGYAEGSDWGWRDAQENDMLSNKNW
jgi:hypothetical protein